MLQSPRLHILVLEGAGEGDARLLSGRRVRFLDSCDFPHTTCMTGTKHTIRKHLQYKFDNNGVYIGIGNCCYFTMPHFKQDFVGTLKKGWRVINRFKGPKAHTIYQGTITWTINENTGNTHRAGIPNFLYFPNGREWLISPQHWAHNTESANTDSTTLDGTHVLTDHELTTLIWGGGYFVLPIPLYKNNIFTTQTVSVYTELNGYCAVVSYEPFLHDGNND